MGSHHVQSCRSSRCGMPVFFAPTEKGKVGIFDAKIPEHATEKMQRVWLDEEGVAHFVKKDEPPPRDKPLYTNHWLTCRDVERFADERLAKARASNHAA